MRWPDQADFRDALQDPEGSFGDPALRACRVELNKLGVPRGRTGAFASVYKLISPDGRAFALKLFHFPSPDRERRYQVVSDYLNELGSHRPASLVVFRYEPKGLRVDRGWYPLQSLDWVSGVALGEWVRTAMVKGDVAAVRRMADRWVRLVAELRAARIAHGDLQHDNVMVVGDTPILVDYDGMCVPALEGAQQLEFGKPAYQHPHRPGQRLSPALDDFAAWVILIALRSAAADPTLYDRYVGRADNENLLFTPEDLHNPTGSRLWSDLRSCPDAEVRDWAAELRACLDRSFDRIPPFNPISTRDPTPPSPGGSGPTITPGPASPGQGASGPRVFVSHSTRDREFVEREIVAVLHGVGVATWYSKDSIQTAAKWEKAIREGLRSCNWFLVALSPHAVASEWVEAEVHWAMGRRQGCIVPVLIDDCDPADLHLMLDQIQYVDFRDEARRADARRKLLAVWGLAAQHRPRG